MDLALASHDEDLMALLRTELTGHEQQLFVTGFAAYLQYDPRKDFVVDLDDVYTWLGFTRKDNTKRLLAKSLTEGVHYRSGPTILLLPKEEQAGVLLPKEENPRGGRPNEQILLTIHGFKQLCMSANTEKGRRVREYYISMEEVLFEFTRRNAVKERERFNATIEEANKDAEEARALVAAKDAELSRFKTKAYEEVPKEDKVYICKEASELNSDRHKIGKAIDTKKRESQLNTGSAQGSKIIFERSTLNAKLIEDIAYMTLKRYHCAREHYNSRVEHSVDILDIACTVVDTLASSFEYMKRGALFRKVIENLEDVWGDDEDDVDGEDNGGDLKESREREVAITRNKLHEFLAMKDDDRTSTSKTYSILMVPGSITWVSDFKRAFEDCMSTKLLLDAATLGTFGYRASGGRENVCKSCKGMAKSRGGRCCDVYDVSNRIKKEVIFDMMLTVSESQ